MDSSPRRGVACGSSPVNGPLTRLWMQPWRNPKRKSEEARPGSPLDCLNRGSLLGPGDPVIRRISFAAASESGSGAVPRPRRRRRQVLPRNQGCEAAPTDSDSDSKPAEKPSGQTTALDSAGSKTAEEKAEGAGSATTSPAKLRKINPEQGGARAPPATWRTWIAGPGLG